MDKQEEEDQQELNCVHQMDYLARCLSLSHQINSFYRHGHSADCSEWADNMKWCLRTKLMSYEKQQQALMSRRQMLTQKERVSATASIWKQRIVPPSDFPPTEVPLETAVRTQE
jgi:hypothetical protein